MTPTTRSSPSASSKDPIKLEMADTKDTEEKNSMVSGSKGFDDDASSSSSFSSQRYSNAMKSLKGFVDTLDSLYPATGISMQPDSDDDSQEPVPEKAREDVDTGDKKNDDQFSTSDAEMMSLAEDVFSLMVVSSWSSRAFWYGMSVFSVQIVIASLIVIDLLSDDEGFDDNNPFNIPIDIDFQVAVAQALALIISAFSQSDVRTTLSMILVKYDSKQLDQYPGASQAKFYISNLCRSLQGILVIVVSFIFIVQSDNILDIFMNFAAVEFISNLSQLAYELAATGFIGNQLEKEIQLVTQVELPMTRGHLRWLMQACFYLIVLGLFGGWGVVRTRQANGYLLTKTSCSSLDVTFGDQYLILPQNVSISLEGSWRQSRVADLGRFDTNEPPPTLLYAYFSGLYAPAYSSGRYKRINDRPVYFENDDQDPTSGTFYYCDAAQAWVFTIPALEDAIPAATKEECGETGWLMRSPQTSAFTLDEAMQESFGIGWALWDGVGLVMTDSFSATCRECNTDTQCSVNHGICGDDGFCECFDGWLGTYCSVRQPFCPSIRLVNTGNKARDYSELGPFDLRLDPDDGSLSLIYLRPSYETIINGADGILFFTGRRWFASYISSEERDAVFDESFHAYWDNIMGNNSTLLVSNPTASFVPYEPSVTWVQLTQEASTQSSPEPFIIFDDTRIVFRCTAVNCAIPYTCGVSGTCSADGTCQCTAFSGGRYCEFSPFEHYASGLYEELQQVLNTTGVDPDDHFADSEYYQIFWAEQVAGLDNDNARGAEL